MANVYDPQSLGIAAPSGGFQQGGWYNGRQYWGGTLSDPGVIHPSSNQQGAGQAVSAEVNLQSDQAQGNNPGDIERYLAQQRQLQQQRGVSPSGNMSPTQSASSGLGMAGLPAQAVAPQATINLPEMYKQLTESSGIKEKESQLADMERKYTEAKGLINDNPYLSEATRVGRVAKLEELHANRTKNLRDEIATAKADAETQLNLQLKQFDINSQQAKQALDQLNFLLESGALNNASGEDVANLTRSTGISSNMIYSAIDATKQKNVKTEVIKSEDDNGVVTVTVIDDKGNVINQQSLGAIGNKQGSSSSDKFNEVEAVNELIMDVRSGQGVAQIFRTYTGLLDPNLVIQVYNANSPHGPAKESEEELARLGVKFE